MRLGEEHAHPGFEGEMLAGVGAFAAQVGIVSWVGPKWVSVHALGSPDLIGGSVGAAKLGGLAHCGFQLFAKITDCSGRSRGFIPRRGGGGGVRWPPFVTERVAGRGLEGGLFWVVIAG